MRNCRLIPKAPNGNEGTSQCNVSISAFDKAAHYFVLLGRLHNCSGGCQDYCKYAFSTFISIFINLIICLFNSGYLNHAKVAVQFMTNCVNPAKNLVHSFFRVILRSQMSFAREICRSEKKNYLSDMEKNLAPLSDKIGDLHNNALSRHHALADKSSPNPTLRLSEMIW